LGKSGLPRSAKKKGGCCKREAKNGCSTTQPGAPEEGGDCEKPQEKTGGVGPKEGFERGVMGEMTKSPKFGGRITTEKESLGKILKKKKRGRTGRGPRKNKSKGGVVQKKDHQ